MTAREHRLLTKIARLSDLLNIAAQTADTDEVLGRDTVHKIYQELCDCARCNGMHGPHEKCDEQRLSLIEKATTA